MKWLVEREASGWGMFGGWEGGGENRLSSIMHSDFGQCSSPSK